MASAGRKQYAGGAATTTLSALLSNSALSFTIASATGWPDGSVGKFVVEVDPGTGTAEKILCDSRSGTSVTVNASGRGYDGTVAIQHANGATVKHVWDAASPTDFARHIYVTTDDDHTQYAKKATVSAPGDVLLRRASVTGASYSTVSNMALVAVDTTNLRCTFTAPATGRVIVRLTANSRNSGSSLTIWGLLEGATQRGAGIDVTSYNNDQVYSAAIEISGLVAGSSHTYDWAFTVGGGTGYVSGHPVMEVWSA
jgi:hypothetical protein